MKQLVLPGLASLIGICLLSSWCISPAKAESSNADFESVFKDRGSSYILVFAYPSAAWLDWSSPSKLSRTSVQSTLAKRMFGLPSTIGHAQFAWSCRQSDSSVVSQGASGQSGENNGQSLASLSAGWGMSILEFVYNDGNLEFDKEVKQRIASGAAGNQFSWAGFKVNHQSCMKLVNFVEKYQASGAYQNYGFPVDPLKYEGAGCTSYANAALEVSEAPIPFREQWLRKYRIPHHLLGRQDKIPDHTLIVPNAKIPEHRLQVPLTDFLLGDLQWAQANEPAIDFQYYDPELFYESFLHLENQYRQQQGLTPKPAVRTAQLDRFQLALKSTIDSWMQNLKQRQTPMELDTIANQSGLIIDLRSEFTH